MLRLAGMMMGTGGLFQEQKNKREARGQKEKGAEKYADSSQASSKPGSPGHMVQGRRDSAGAQQEP